MGAAIQSSFAACLAPIESLTDENDKFGNKSVVDDEVHPVRNNEVKVHSNDVNKELKTKRNEEEKVRVQAAEDIHYGSAGVVLKGATGIVLGKFEGNGNPFIFINWDAFPELGRVSVQPEKLLPMHDDRPGTYVITREAGVTQTEALAKEVVSILPVGTTVKLVEVVHVPEAKRWRGRLEQPVKGWISVLASNNGARWAEQPLVSGAGKTQQVARNGAPPTKLATTGSFQVDSSQHRIQYMGSTRGRSPARAGVSSHMVVSSERSLSAQRAATAVYGNYTGRAYSSSRPNSLPPSQAGSQAGSFHCAVQPQSPFSRNNSFQYTVNSETFSTTSSCHGSVQFPTSGSVPASSVRYVSARVLDRPASFAAVEQQALSASLSAPRILSMHEVPSQAGSASLDPPSAQSAASNGSAPPRRQDNKKTSPEVLAVLQGIKQQLRGMADRYTDNTNDARGDGSPTDAIHKQAVSSTEADAPAKGASREEELPEKWMGA